jgi:serine/threonine protein kinase
MLKQIIQAFQTLANKKIIHRDLKPSNIFINNNEQLVIGDFGFAVKLQ